MKFYRLSGATFYEGIDIFKPFLDNKMSIFEENGAFKSASTKANRNICG